MVFRDDYLPTGGSDDNRGDGTELTAERNKGVCVCVCVCVVFADVAKGNYPSSQDGRYVTIRVYCTVLLLLLLLHTNNIVLRDVVVVRVTTAEENY